MKTKNSKTMETVNNAISAIEELHSRIAGLEEENERLKARLGEDAKNVVDSSFAFDCLAVTNVQVFPFKEAPTMGHLKGLAQIVLNDQMVIRGLRIMDGVNGLFVSYPIDPFYKGEDFRAVCNPITRQLREHIENCVLEKYQAAVV